MHIPLSFPESQHKNFSLESFTQDGITYQRLLENGIVKMVNTPEIVCDFKDFLQRAEGHILINGLGMGMCNVYLLNKRSVKSLTVVELNKDLVDFIKPFFDHDPRCSIYVGDAFSFQPPKNVTYDYVWHDVWTHQSIHNIPQIDTLRKKYENKARWQGAWREDKCHEQVKHERKLLKLEY